MYVGGYNLILHDYIKNSYLKKKKLRVEMIYEKLEESQTEWVWKVHSGSGALS